MSDRRILAPKRLLLPRPPHSGKPHGSALRNGILQYTDTRGCRGRLGHTLRVVDAHEMLWLHGDHATAKDERFASHKHHLGGRKVQYKAAFSPPDCRHLPRLRHASENPRWRAMTKMPTATRLDPHQGRDPLAHRRSPSSMKRERGNVSQPLTHETRR